MKVELHPNFIEKNGKKEFVVIAYEEYIKIKEQLEDYEDLIDLRKAKEKEKNKIGKSLEKVRKELGL
ncbi:MAG: prevent-host-death family protein [Spirochaetes bacterium GWB1_36_13]|nr:MAG: prevent-host-death family protein [Spirochaetes bacterium GWB1_36_13]